MNTFQIRCFVQLSQTLNYRKAAEDLFISVSTLSRTIKNLESELDLQLFGRDNKMVRLTPGGRIMLDGILRLQSEFAEIHSLAVAASDAEKTLIRIGIAQEFMPGFLPYAVASYEAAHKNTRVVFSSCTFPQLQRRFLSGQLDIVVGNPDELELGNYEQRVIEGPKIGVAFSVMHPLAKHEGPLSLADFAEDVFVTMPDDVVPARKNLFDRCEKLGFTPKHIYAEDMSELLLMLETNRAVSILYGNLSLMSRDLVTFRTVEGIDPVKMAIIWDKSSGNKNVLHFVDYVIQAI